MTTGTGHPATTRVCGHEVSDRHKFIDGVDLRRRVVRTDRDERVEHHDLQAEGERSISNGTTDVPEADQPEDAPTQLAPEELCTLETRRGRGGHHGRRIAVPSGTRGRASQGTQSSAFDGRSVLARRRHHADPQIRCGVDVDVDRSAPSASDEAKRRRGSEDLTRDRRTVHDEHLDVVHPRHQLTRIAQELGDARRRSFDR
jgi:hypothetical protein